MSTKTETNNLLNTLCGINAALNELMSDRNTQDAIVSLDADGRDRWGSLCQMLDATADAIDKPTATPIPATLTLVRRAIREIDREQSIPDMAMVHHALLAAETHIEGLERIRDAARKVRGFQGMLTFDETCELSQSQEALDQALAALPEQGGKGETL